MPLVAQNTAAELYLNLLKKVLTRSAFPERYREFSRSKLRRNKLAYLLYPLIQNTLRPLNLALCSTKSSQEARAHGTDWPAEAETMIGDKRMTNLHDCIRTVLEDGIPGDFIETGVWRGGASIFMRAALAAYGDESRIVWLADSFAGLPPP